MGHLRVIRAGKEIILNSRAEDPDGDEVYASCNIGSIGQVGNGDTIWTFQTNFPGIYRLEIIFFDIRGGGMQWPPLRLRLFSGGPIIVNALNKMT